ncbi:hypothetical protein J2T57_004117 [Natronocella acetinitrilica]|uniref:Uncharacterized protein n=1 Tax=Natronocella acetinitrilica TaxID=414046 RepID=A0AAE3G8G1_9GAMM|nr:polyhydroxyalkanoate granule-associated phasin [Natronocella acetinitrilica]MCP1676943.1 hypothetical protein [Natronocella acetinitrilica]
MTNSTHKGTKRLAMQTVRLAVAVPQVVSIRMARMALSGPNPTSRDRTEFQRMGAEKLEAFGESWNAMAWQMLRANQALTLSMMRSWWSPWFGGQPSLASAMQQAQGAALGVLGAGMAPVSRRARANAKRLGKSIIWS